MYYIIRKCKSHDEKQINASFISFDPFGDALFNFMLLILIFDFVCAESLPSRTISLSFSEII